MKTKMFFKVRKVLFIVAVFAIALSSCRSSRNLAVSELRSISTGRLLKSVENNALDYEYLTIRRINCQFDDGQTKTNFKINLKAIRNEKILVSISKLNLPVGRVLLTPDSVKYVNYMERNYFVDDYSYLSDVLNIDLDFETIQSIISNNAFSYRNDEKDFKTFDSFIEAGRYVLQSEKNRKIEKMDETTNKNKIKRRMNRLGEDAFIIQKMYFNPDFALAKLIIQDKTNKRTMQMDFDDFVEVGKVDYPGSIEMSFISPKNTVALKTKMSGFSTGKINSFNFRIPEKYEQIHVN